MFICFDYLPPIDSAARLSTNCYGARAEASVSHMLHQFHICFKNTGSQMVDLNTVVEKLHKPAVHLPPIKM